MGRCRCADIERCQRNQRKLEEAIQLTEEALLCCRRYQMQTDNIIRYSRVCYETENEEAISSSIERKGRRPEETVKQVRAGLSHRYQAMEQELKDMQSEDRSWHEEQQMQEKGHVSDQFGDIAGNYKYL
ncbi:MAG: hypothetical protein UFG06_03145 [Lachnospiraceae bacterium]|nr:hypothetical protein [Lachnospiraceae bacterium]